MAEKDVNACSVGILTNTDCHLSTSTKNNDLHHLKDLSANDITLLKYRIEKCQSILTGTICEHHKSKYLTYYTQYIRKCLNPLDIHKTPVRGDLRVLKFDFCETVLQNLKLKLIPGDKICKRCESALKQNLNQDQKEESTIATVNTHTDDNNVGIRRSDRIADQEKMYFDTENQEGSSQNTNISSDSSDFVTLSQGQKELNNVLTRLGMHNLESSQVFRTRRAIDANNLIDGVCRNFAKQCSTALNMEVLIPEPVSPSIVEDSSILQQLIVNIQKEFEHLKTVNKKLQYLALLPRDWSQRKICQYFPCTNYLFEKLRKFREMDDYPENIKSATRQKYAKVSNELQQLIKNYYLNDEHVYTCPGKKDFVSIIDELTGRKMFIQKKLLLYTVYDLYLKLKEEYNGSEKLPSYSYFYSLKPPECIHAGDPGSHAICLCAQHENVNLKLHALSRKLKSRDIIAGAVCDIESECCMTKNCKNCPGESGVLNLFEKILEELDIELKDGKIKYKNWVEQGSAASLENFEDDSEDLKKQICTDINNLTLHQFVADAQKKYLNYCKNNLASDECIILMDFSENYSFIIQNSVQAFYYNNEQATIHPFVIYYKSRENGKLLNVNYCVISDSKDHLAYAVNAFTSELVSVIKEKFTWIKSIIYFSDGAPQQYKNKNHLANIFLHEEDFGLKISSYNFFATSHGKSPCDATGGILKRFIMRHCIRSPPENQITDAREMYEYALEHLTSIKVLWVPTAVVKRFERKLQHRFSVVKTFPQTRLHHCFIPIKGSMKMKVTSFSTEEKCINLL